MRPTVPGDMANGSSVVDLEESLDRRVERGGHDDDLATRPGQSDAEVRNELDCVDDVRASTRKKAMLRAPPPSCRPRSLVAVRRTSDASDPVGLSTSARCLHQWVSTTGTVPRSGAQDVGGILGRRRRSARPSMSKAQSKPIAPPTRIPRIPGMTYRAIPGRTGGNGGPTKSPTLSPRSWIVVTCCSKDEICVVIAPASAARTDPRTGWVIAWARASM